MMIISLCFQAILLTGELDEDEENPYAEVNWNKIFDNLDEDWIILTNSGKLLENMTHIGYEHRNQFVYSNRAFDTREVLSPVRDMHISHLSSENV